jgi:hypothetical protein
VKVGDLVRLQLHPDLEAVHLELPIAGRGKLGIVVQCEGARCRVQWSDGKRSLPQRTVLRIISASR